MNITSENIHRVVRATLNRLEEEYGWTVTASGLPLADTTEDEREDAVSLMVKAISYACADVEASGE